MKDTDKQRNVKTLKAASWYTISNFLSKCMLYLFTPLYTRVLSKVEYGLYNNYLSWQSILVVVLTLDLGATVAIAYIDYKDPKKFHQYIGTISFLSLVVPLFFGIIMLVFSQQFSQLFGMAPVYILFIVISMCMTNALQIFQAEQQSKVQYKLSSALTLGAAAGNMLLTLLFVWLFRDKLLGVVLGGIIGTAVVNCSVYFYVFRRSFCVKGEYVRYALRIALPLLPHMVSSILLGSSTKILITRFCGTEDTAFYSVVNNCAMVVLLFVNSVNTAWVPWFFNRMDNKDYASVQKVTRVTIPLVGLCALAVCLAGPEVVLVIGGASYAPAVRMIPPMIFSCVVRYVYTLYVNIEFYNKKTGGISIGTVITALAHISLNIVLLRLFNYQAAAYTMLLSELLLLIIHMFIVKKQGMWHVFNNRQNILLLAVAGVACMCILLVYPVPILRYGIIAAAFVAVVVAVVKFRAQILGLLKKLKK